mmetsp:Transcript_30182/g.78228  ORF Transcript_30182/g.78228 Transcript_30182/m.78228 type:complete len:253 (+) Transcript_30182:49-807(+)|eukprot:CAMPEP_0115854772 /NCGR_PEP_ID=MMETSP0287-20121206/14198_1 /TAXON_ID=412157 /ORGANISM="Chrysochromulina rotalis, Strain UIO044" /LENGTH=252 /DNA_ID=CAMNT_0003308903 /DNA_START=48 /DNA_END=806 /DNA_ORIENTATION=+
MGWFVLCCLAPAAMNSNNPVSGSSAFIGISAMPARTSLNDLVTTYPPLQPIKPKGKLGKSNVAKVQAPRGQGRVGDTMQSDIKLPKSDLDNAFAAALKEQIAEKKVADNMLRRAESGDGWAMHALGCWYGSGLKGLKQDHGKHFEWMTKSHEAGHPGGTAALGLCYINGQGVETNRPHGLMLMAEAATLGSQCACSNLGDMYAAGRDGVPKDLSIAHRWYAKVPGASVKDLAPAGVQEVALWLKLNSEAQEQ